MEAVGQYLLVQQDERTNFGTVVSMGQHARELLTGVSCGDLVWFENELGEAGDCLVVNADYVMAVEKEGECEAHSEIASFLTSPPERDRKEHPLEADWDWMLGRWVGRQAADPYTFRERMAKIASLAIRAMRADDVEPLSA